MSETISIVCKSCGHEKDIGVMSRGRFISELTIQEIEGMLNETNYLEDEYFNVISLKELKKRIDKK